jgi:hypothetical protein
MCVCYAVYPGEAPKCLGLRVLRARSCRGEKTIASRMVEDHGLAPERSEPNVDGSGC